MTEKKAARCLNCAGPHRHRFFSINTYYTTTQILPWMVESSDVEPRIRLGGLTVLFAVSTELGSGRIGARNPPHASRVNYTSFLSTYETLFKTKQNLK